MDQRMKWTVLDKYHAVSDCGAYKIAKGIIRDITRYVPYHVDNGKSTMLSNGLITVEAAKTVCEIHAKTKKGSR